MTLDRLTIFAAVAKHRNVTRASRELHLSQPAVSKQLKLLEKHYNTKLFRRGGRGMELTEAGRVFLRDVKAILKRYERFTGKFSAAPSTAKVETLTVGGSISPSVHFLPSMLARFKRTHPHVQFNFRTGTRLAMERLILDSEVDIALITNAPANPGLVLELLRPEPLVAFVYPDHPLARNQELTLQEFERVPLTILKTWKGTGTTERFLREMKKKGLNLNIAMRCDSPAAVKETVSKKMGMGILFKDTIEPEVGKGRFKILKLPVKNFAGKSFIVYRKDRSLSANAQDFLDLLRRSRPRLVRDQSKMKRPEGKIQKTILTGSN
jgi:DNA-binding transcriptional LysR family regulator